MLHLRCRSAADAAREAVQNKMILRRLNREEHGKTRGLWEEIFTEDTGSFLDYYYFIKTQDNDIYVIEEDGKIRSMLHLNPYRIRIEGREFPSVYIVAVATQKKYRSRGFMRNLLCCSLQDMYDRKIPFTFLMPAAEAIYLPYDFRYIYDQSMEEISECNYQNLEDNRSSEHNTSDCDEKDAALWDSEKISEFFNRYFAGKWQVCTVRDSTYYQTMIMEQQSEHGGIRLLFEKGSLIGMYDYAEEDGIEIREPLILHGYEPRLRKSVWNLASGTFAAYCEKEKNTPKKIKIYACTGEEMQVKKPLIMARIVHIPSLLGALKTRINDCLDCSFAVIDPIIHQNSRIWKIISIKGEEQICVQETEDSEGVIPVAELTEFLFGRINTEELKKRKGTVLSDHLCCELEKIIPLKRIYLNEVV